MPLWKTSDTVTDAGKPKHLSDAQKKNTYATEKGWVYRAGGQYTDMHGVVRNKEEILVAVRNLAGSNSSTGMANATISAIEFTSSTLALAGSLSARITFNEEVVVIGSPTIAVSAANTTENTVPASLTLTYASGNNTNRLTFTGTAYSNVATYSFANTGLAITSGSIKDAVSNTVNAEKYVLGLYTGSNSTIGSVTSA
jgi:hypothetical protein